MQKSDQISQRVFGLLQSWTGITLCLWLGFLGLYLAFPSQQYDKDVLAELARINVFDPTVTSPAHMLYALVGIPLYKLWLSMGYAGDALRVMQILNAFCGAGAIAWLGLILRQLRIQRIIAVPIAVAAGLSYAFWTHTEDAFFIIPAACFALLAWLCAFLLAEARPHARWWAFSPILAVSLSLSVLFYQTNLLLIPCLLVASWPGGHKKRQWLWSWLGIGLLIALLAGGVWLYQGIRFAQAATPKDWIVWFISGHGGIERGLWRREGIAVLSTTFVAWGATILPLYEGMRLRDLIFNRVIDCQYIPAQLALLCTGSIIGLAVSDIMLRLWRRRKISIPSRFWLACGLWFAIPGLAVLWFDRAEVKLWLIPMLAFWVVIALILSLKYNDAKQFSSRLWWMILVMLFPVLVGTSNLMLAIWPNHTLESLEIGKARWVSGISPGRTISSGCIEQTSDSLPGPSEAVEIGWWC